MNKRSSPPSGGRSGGAAADEDLHRMDICVGWMYEFSSRHRMEDVQEALVRLAETRFHISLESLQKLSDPCSILQQFLDKGEFEQAYSEFETQMEDFRPVLGEQLYSSTLVQIMIQVALQNLRADGGKYNLDDFKQRVKDIFPEAGKKKADEHAATLAKLRTELLSTTKKDASKLLEKYGLRAFKENTAGFWRALRRAQRPTKLERVIQDIDEGKIKWDDSDAEDVEEEAQSPSTSRAPVPFPAVVAAASAAAALVAAAPSNKAAAEDKRHKKRVGFVMSAWELREAFAPEADTLDDSVVSQWTSLHSQEHPEVKCYLIERKKLLEKKRANDKDPHQSHVQEHLPLKKEARRGLQAKASAELARDAAEADDEEIEKEDDNEDVKGASPSPKRRKVEARGAGGVASGKSARGRANLDVSPQSTNLGDTEEEEEEEPVRRGSGKGVNEKGGSKPVASPSSRGVNQKDMALIEALQDKSKRLGEIGDDPLEAAMANARGARGGVGGARIKSYEPDAYAKGTKVNFDDPDDDADQGGPVLQLPATNTSFKLRDLKVLGDVSSNTNVGRRAPSGNSCRVGAKKNCRWSPQEEEALLAGVKEYGEGNWKKIQEGAALLKSRSTVDCKDKWRNIGRQYDRRN